MICLFLTIHTRHLQVHADDGLPQRICKVCLERCNFWMEFRKKAEENQNYLRALVDETQWTPEETEPLAKVQRKRPVIELVVPEDDEEFEVIAGELVDSELVEQEDFDDDEPNPEADTNDVGLAQDWESVLHDASVYPVEPTPIVNRQGNDPVIICPVPECSQEFVGFKSYETHCMTHVDKKVSPAVTNKCSYLTPLFCPQNIICPICNLPYERAENYKNHMYIHANQKFGCPECDKLFTRPKTLSDHMRDSHSKFMRKEKEDPLPGFDKAPVAKKRKSTGAVEDDGGDQPPTAPQKDFNEDGSEVLVRCPECLLGCSSFKAFEDHVGSHVSRSARACPICQQTFVRMENLKFHMYVHTDNQFNCALCPRTFVNPKTLASHLRVDHASEVAETNDGVKKEPDVTNPGLTCSYCGKICDNKRQLREHLKLHTADTQYPCSECPVQFRLKKSLRAHMSNVHRDIQRPLACTICGRSVESKEKLGKHMLREHSDVDNLCAQCGSVHKSSQALRMHQKTMHTTVKPTVCPICGKAYKLKKGFRKHMAKHTDEKRISCDLCGTLFLSPLSLQMHVRNAHKVEANSVKS